MTQSSASETTVVPPRPSILSTRSSKLATQLTTPDDEHALQQATAHRDAPKVKTPSIPLHQNKDAVYFYSSLVAGVGSGALSSILCAPLDLVRVRMQVWGQVCRETGSKKIPITQLLKEIRQREGWRGYFRGLGATLLTVPAFWGVYFPLYDDFKRRCAKRYPDVNPSLIHMGSAVMAGAISDIICNPMFVVRTRLQTEALHNVVEHKVQHRSSILQTVQSLYREGGPKVFWRGMTANLFGLSHVAVQFPVYEQLKKFLRTRGHKKHESALDLVLASSLSKMSASLLTYPHEVIRSRMMDVRSSAGVGFIATCRQIYQREGFLGFYSGLPVSLIRVIPNTCVTFVTYELILRWTREQIELRNEK